MDNDAKENKDGKKLYRRMGLWLTNDEQWLIAVGLYIVSIPLDFLMVILISAVSSLVVGATIGFFIFVVFSALLAYSYKIYRSRRD